MVLQDIGRVDSALRLVVRLPPHGPGEVLRVVPLGGAGGHEEVRHLGLVHVLVYGGIGGRAEGLEEGRHLVLLHELPDHLHRLGRRIGIVVRDEVDLAPVDAAIVVDLLEVGGEGLADGSVAILISVAVTPTTVWAPATDVSPAPSMAPASASAVSFFPIMLSSVVLFGQRSEDCACVVETASPPRFWETRDTT